MWHRLRHARKDERGTVTLFMAVVLGVLMVSSAFVVDLGMQKVARADMQALADVVALDLARELDGRSVAQLDGVLDAAVDASLSRNRDMIGSDEPDLDYTLGAMSSGQFQPMASGVPTAVSVVARTDVDFAFASVTGEESGGAQQDAAAESSSTACFRLGSFVGAIRSSDSTVLGPLNDLFGVNLDLVSYKALAAADVRLSQLAAVSTIGSPEALLQGSILYRDLLRAIVQALTAEGVGLNGVAITALNRIIGSSVSGTVGAIRLADVLHVSPTDRAAMQVSLDVLDIVGSARLADGKHFLGVPKIQSQVPGVGWQFSGAVYLVSAAELACGKPNSAEATADNAQLSGSVGVDFVNLPSLSIPGLATLQTPKGVGTIVVEIGSGQGRLVAPPEVHCGQGTSVDPSKFTVDVSSQLSSYRIDADLSVTGEVKVTDLTGLGLLNVLQDVFGILLDLKGKMTIDAEVRLSVGTSSGAHHGSANLSIPPNDVDPIRLGSSVYLDPSNVVPTVKSLRLNGKAMALDRVKPLVDKILAELVSASNGFLSKTLTPLIDNINQDFIGPVARMIGLRFGGADVFAVGVRCGDPRLVG